MMNPNKLPNFKGDVGIYFRRNSLVLLYAVALFVLVLLTFIFGESILYLFFPVATLCVILFILATAPDKYVVCFYENELIYHKGKKSQSFSYQSIKVVKSTWSKAGWMFVLRMDDRRPIRFCLGVDYVQSSSVEDFEKFLKEKAPEAKMKFQKDHFHGWF